MSLNDVMQMSLLMRDTIIDLFGEYSFGPQDV